MNIFTRWQLAFARFVLFIFKTLTRLEVYGVENLDRIERPFLLTLNHKSMIDSFLAGAVVIRSKPTLAPLSFMTKDRLFWYPLLNLLLWSLGAFKARKKRGLEKTLETPIRILRGNGALVVFPEAHIVPDLTRLGEGRKGTAILAYSTGVPLLPVSFFIDRHLTLKNLLSRAPRVIIRIGEPYSLGSANPHVTDEKLQEATGTIMKKIWELYRQDVPSLTPARR